MPDPRLLRVCGIVALVAAALPVPCDIVSWVLAENYSPVRNSISALAVGPSSWLIDLGLWCFVVTSLAVVVGLWAWRIRARFWTPAIVSLALAGVCVGIGRSAACEGSERRSPDRRARRRPHVDS